VPEDSSKTRFTVVMEATLDIIMWLEGDKKMINISHTCGMNCSSVFNMLVIEINLDVHWEAFYTLIHFIP
jgi:hypothetical protein